MSPTMFWLAILGAGAGTFGLRLSLIALLGRVEVPPFMERALRWEFSRYVGLLAKRLSNNEDAGRGGQAALPRQGQGRTKCTELTNKPYTNSARTSGARPRGSARHIWNVKTTKRGRTWCGISVGSSPDSSKRRTSRRVPRRVPTRL